MIIIAGCGLTPGESLAGNARATGKARAAAQLAAPITCAGGTMCDGTPVTGKDGQVVCGTDLENWKCTAKGWQKVKERNGLGQTCVCPGKKSGTVIFKGLPLLSSIEKEKVDESTAYGKLYSQCFGVYAGCTTKELNLMLTQSTAFGTDFGKFVYNHKSDFKQLGIDASDPKSIVNVMYKGLTVEQAKAFSQLLLVEEVERKKAKEEAMQTEIQASLKAGKSAAVAGKKEYLAEQAQSQSGVSQNKLQMIADLVMSGKLGSPEWELEHKGEEEFDVLGEAGAAVGGKSDFLSSMGSCLQAASKWNLPGKKGGSSSGAQGALKGDKGGQISQSAGWKTGTGTGNGGGQPGKISGGGVPKTPEGGSDTTDAKGGGGGAKPQGGGFAKTPSGGGVGDSDEGIGNSEFAKDQASDKGAPCEAVNWAQMLGGGEITNEGDPQVGDQTDTGKVQSISYVPGAKTPDGTDIYSKNVVTEQTNKDGSTTVTKDSYLVTIKTDKNGKSTIVNHGKFKQETFKNGKSQGSNYYTVKVKNTETGKQVKDGNGKDVVYPPSAGFIGEYSTKLKYPPQKDENGKVKVDKKTGNAIEDKTKTGKPVEEYSPGLYEAFIENENSGFSPLTEEDLFKYANPLADVSKGKNPYQMCKGAMGATGAGGACVDAAIDAEFKQSDKSVKEENCDKVGQGGPDASVNCGKKKMDAEGFDATSFEYGTSGGKGVTDPPSSG